ncbi:hypothetical protein IWQ56_001758 [Coemansia nantahalensis]|uniref:Uncharacterized protein n=1 Tax=Coemansia nantahalensis TaxID=2789366 RepID=A0ACC1K0N6_9FUNG|nr:hypothetical protein IWQ57_002390 [Coemansia nantahalensis]KAJ2771506.1 hypothetical protein IWQ56_001758 [Coemansia nantahalensis]
MDSGFGAYLDRLSSNGPLRAATMLLNTVAATAAIFLVVTGVVDLFSRYSAFSGTAGPVTGIVLGTVIAAVSLVGIVGPAKRSQHICGAYAGLAAVLVAVQLVALVALWLQPVDAEDSLARAWTKLYESDPATIRYVEQDLRCCGFRNPLDMPVPAHCSIKKKYGFAAGCLAPLQSAWEQRRTSIAWAGMVLVSAQLLALMLGVDLARRYKRSREGYQQLAGSEEADSAAQAA